MKCRKVMCLLSPYLDRELDVKKTELVLHHLEECEDCRAQLVELERISESIRDFVPIEPPPRFEDVVLAKARCHQQPAPSLIRTFLTVPRYRFAFGLTLSVTVLLAVALLLDLVPFIQYGPTEPDQVASHSINSSINENERKSPSPSRQQQYDNHWLQFVNQDNSTDSSFKVKPFFIDHQLFDAEEMLLILDAQYQHRIICQPCKKRLDLLTFRPRDSVSGTDENIRARNDDHFNQDLTYTNLVD